MVFTGKGLSVFPSREERGCAWARPVDLGLSLPVEGRLPRGSRGRGRLPRGPGVPGGPLLSAAVAFIMSMLLFYRRLCIAYPLRKGSNGK